MNSEPDQRQTWSLYFPSQGNLSNQLIVSGGDLYLTDDVFYVSSSTAEDSGSNWIGHMISISLSPLCSVRRVAIEGPSVIRQRCKCKRWKGRRKRRRNWSRSRGRWGGGKGGRGGGGVLEMSGGKMGRRGEPVVVIVIVGVVVVVEE